MGQLTAVKRTLLLFYGPELLVRWRPVIALFAWVCSRFCSSDVSRGGAEILGFLFFSKLFPSYQRCLGTTKQRLMDTWNSWRRPRWRTWTRQMRMAWLPPYWLLFMDISVLFSSYAAESKFSIACPSSHILHWDKNDLNIWVLVKCFLQAV